MDPRTYIRLHDGMPDHPKVVGLSDAAFRLYVEAMCWCSRHLTDGAVPVAAMRRMGGWSPESTEELTAARLFEDVNGNGARDIHDYTEHQRTAEDVAEYREAKRVAGVAGNHERWHSARGVIDPSCEACCIPDASHARSVKDRTKESHQRSQTDRKTSPETETETEEKKRLAQIGSDADPDFTEFWAAYPRKISKGAARKAYRSAVIGKLADPKQITLRTELFRAEQKRLGVEVKYIPHPATWLNGERYGDEPEAENSPAAPAHDPWEQPWRN